MGRKHKLYFIWVVFVALHNFSADCVTFFCYKHDIKDITKIYLSPLMVNVSNS